jgi:hypothetical protein
MGRSNKAFKYNFAEGDYREVMQVPRKEGNYKAIMDPNSKETANMKTQIAAGNAKREAKESK